MPLYEDPYFSGFRAQSKAYDESRESRSRSMLAEAEAKLKQVGVKDATIDLILKGAMAGDPAYVKMAESFAKSSLPGTTSQATPETPTTETFRREGLLGPQKRAEESFSGEQVRPAPSAGFRRMDPRDPSNLPLSGRAGAEIGDISRTGQVSAFADTMLDRDAPVGQRHAYKVMGSLEALKKPVEWSKALGEGAASRLEPFKRQSEVFENEAQGRANLALESERDTLTPLRGAELRASTGDIQSRTGERERLLPGKERLMKAREEQVRSRMGFSPSRGGTTAGGARPMTEGQLTNNVRQIQKELYRAKAISRVEGAKLKDWDRAFGEEKSKYESRWIGGTKPELPPEYSDAQAKKEAADEYIQQLQDQLEDIAGGTTAGSVTTPKTAPTEDPIRAQIRKKLRERYATP